MHLLVMENEIVDIRQSPLLYLDCRGWDLFFDYWCSLPILTGSNPCHGPPQYAIIIGCPHAALATNVLPQHLVPLVVEDILPQRTQENKIHGLLIFC